MKVIMKPSRMLTIQAQNIQNLLLSQQKFNDVTFIIGKNKTEFNANRLLLAAISPVFEAMLYGQMHESKKDSDVIIEDVDELAFEAVLTYAYCGDPQITEQNVLNIQHICRKYQIETLAGFCDKYFRSYLNVDNFCVLLNGAVKLKLDECVQHCHDCYATLRKHNKRNGYANSKSFSSLGSNLRFFVGKEQVQYNAHTFLMSNISSVFQEMINDNKSKILINADDVDASAFANVLEYSYCKKPNFTPTNIMQTKCICKKYKIHSLSDLCDEYFASTLNTSNFCSLLDTVIKAKDVGFIQKCHAFLGNSNDYFYHKDRNHRYTHPDNFSGSSILCPSFMRNKAEFLELSLAAMISLLKSDYFNINEELLWDYVTEWAVFQSNKINKCHSENKCEEKEQEHFEKSNYKLYLLKSIRQFIRFGLMRGDFIAKHVKHLNVLDDHELATILVYSFDKQQGCGDFITKNRQKKRQNTFRRW